MWDSFDESLFTHFYQYAPQAAMSWSGVSSFKLLMTRVTPAGMCSGVSNILESGTIRHLTNCLESSHNHMQSEYIFSMPDLAAIFGTSCLQQEQLVPQPDYPLAQDRRQRRQEAEEGRNEKRTLGRCQELACLPSLQNQRSHKLHGGTG